LWLVCIIAFRFRNPEAKLFFVFLPKLQMVSVFKPLLYMPPPHVWLKAPRVKFFFCEFQDPAGVTAFKKPVPNAARSAVRDLVSSVLSEINV